MDDGTLANLNQRWDWAVSASNKFCDFLQTHCSEDALRLVEACPDNGLEAWRILKKRYDPASDRLVGTYYQAVAQQSFEVQFVRK